VADWLQGASIVGIRGNTRENVALSITFHLKVKGEVDGAPLREHSLFVWCLTALSAQLSYIVPQMYEIYIV